MIIEAVENRIAALTLMFAKKAATGAPFVEVAGKDLVRTLTDVDVLRGTATVNVSGQSVTIAAHEVRVITDMGNAS